MNRSGQNWYNLLYLYSLKSLETGRSKITELLFYLASPIWVIEDAKKNFQQKIALMLLTPWREEDGLLLSPHYHH